MGFWDALDSISSNQQIMFAVALLIAFGFEFINGFHDTANAVTTVIYTRTLTAGPAVVYSGFLNFFGVLVGGTGVAFGIVNLLPVDLLVDSGVSSSSLVMVLSILLAGVIWNLGTWYMGLPVSSSHTLIGSILGVGVANSLINHRGLEGVNWIKAGETMLALLISPLIGFLSAGGLLLAMKRLVRDPELYVPPQGDERPPRWIRIILLGTCGGVSFAHGSNDGQKGMGLILLVLVGFLPFHYCLDLQRDGLAPTVRESASAIKTTLDKSGTPVSEHLAADFDTIEKHLAGKHNLSEIQPAPGNTDPRWEVRQAIMRISLTLEGDLPIEVKTEVEPSRKAMMTATEFVPLWVKIGVAIALGVGTTIGYKRIVTTVAEKIGKTHLTYAQGAAAEVVAAATIGLADVFHLPVSTTHVLSSGVAGTMAANHSGIQSSTIRKIALAWILTLPVAMVLAAALFSAGLLIIGRQVFG